MSTGFPRFIHILIIPQKHAANFGIAIYRYTGNTCIAHMDSTMKYAFYRHFQKIGVFSVNKNFFHEKSYGSHFMP